MATDWSAVFLANLPVPLLLACIATDRVARVGMIAAIGTFYALGLESCRRAPVLRSLFIPGGLMIALLQLCPMLQFWAGGCSLGITHRLGLSQEDAVAGLLGGYVVTLLTGAILLTIGSVSALVFRAVVVVTRVLLTMN
jgi:hypothetical protein